VVERGEKSARRVQRAYKRGLNMPGVKTAHNKMCVCIIRTYAVSAEARDVSVFRPRRTTRARLDGEILFHKTAVSNLSKIHF